MSSSSRKIWRRSRSVAAHSSRWIRFDFWSIRILLKVNQMCVKLIAASWPIAMPPSAKLVLVRLADRANPKNGNACWPSVGTVARDTGLSERTVQTQINFLERAGHITIERRWGRSSKYHLHPSNDVVPEEVSPPKSGVSRCADCVPHPRNDCTQTVKKNKKKPLRSDYKWPNFEMPLKPIYGTEYPRPSECSGRRTTTILSENLLEDFLGLQSQTQHEGANDEIASK